MDDVVRIAAGELGAIVIGQHVVRWGNDRIEVGVGIAEGAERFEAWHRLSVPSLPLVTRADVIVCDLDGVVWLSGTPIPGSVDAIARLRAGGYRVVFVTNSSAPTIAEHTASLEAIGIPAAGDVVSSATAAGSLIGHGERVLVCGGAGVTEAVEHAGAVAVDASAAVETESFDAAVVGLDLRFDYRRLAATSRAIRRGARFIACNTDPVYPTPSGPTPGAGSVVAAVATASQHEPIVAGKPHAAVAAAIAAMLGTTSDDPRLAQRLIVVGDSPSTDGALAERFGCRFALVHTGNTPPNQADQRDRRLVDLSTIASEVLAGS